MEIKYGYFIGGIILFIVWLILFFIRKDLQKEIIFASILGLPFAFTEFLFVPEYWNPPSLFNLISNIGFGIESLMFAFFVSGICSITFEILTSKKLFHFSKYNRFRYIPYICILSTFIILELIFPNKSIYNLMISFSIGAILLFSLRKDLLIQILSSGLIFSILYFLLFLYFNELFPQYITNIYSLKNFWGIVIFKVPLEEILFAFTVGMCYSSLYEFINNYKTS